MYTIKDIIIGFCIGEVISIAILWLNHVIHLRRYRKKALGRNKQTASMSNFWPKTSIASILSANLSSYCAGLAKCKPEEVLYFFGRIDAIYEIVHALDSRIDKEIFDISVKLVNQRKKDMCSSQSDCSSE